MYGLIIPKYHDRISEHPENKWVGTETRKYFLESWSLFTLEYIADFWNGTMEY